MEPSHESEHYYNPEVGLKIRQTVVLDALVHVVLLLLLVVVDRSLDFLDFHHRRHLHRLLTPRVVDVVEQIHLPVVKLTSRRQLLVDKFVLLDLVHDLLLRSPRNDEQQFLLLHLNAFQEKQLDGAVDQIEGHLNEQNLNHVCLNGVVDLIYLAVNVLDKREDQVGKGVEVEFVKEQSAAD